MMITANENFLDNLTAVGCREHLRPPVSVFDSPQDKTGLSKEPIERIQQD